MKKILLCLGLSLIFCVTVCTQENSSQQSKFQFSFVPPLSTNGKYAAQYTNRFSLNLLIGISKNETAFTIGGIANIIKHNANGLQMAGLVNYIGNEGDGGLLSGLANITMGHYNGFQMSGLINRAKVTNGSQIAGLGNITQTMNGFQLAGLLNKAENANGFQLAGLGNLALNMNGFQLAGLINAAKDVHSSQIAGLINIARNVSGVQLAGLINIAEKSDYPIGIVNIIKSGDKRVSISYNEIGSTIAAFRSGGKYTYGILGAGYNHQSNGSSFVTVVGLGAHISCTSWFRIDNEINFENISDFADETTFRTGYTLLPVFSIGSHIELFGGPSINYMETDNINNTVLFPKKSLWNAVGDSKNQQLYFGYQFGIQYLF